MRRIISKFVNYPFYGKVIVFLLFVLGGFSLNEMKKSSFPLLPSRTINVSVFYRGASPKEMEEGVTSLVENALRGIPGIKEMNSVSAENSANITITTLPEYNTDKVLYEVKNAVDGISNFPAGAEKPQVSKRRATSMATFMDLYGDASLMKLKKYAQQIEDDFLASGIISQVQIYGYPSLEISVEVKEDQLQRYGISIDQIRSAIRSNNLDITGGTVKHQREELKVLSRQRSVDEDDIRNIVVFAKDNGQVVKVSDLADVKLMFQDTPNAAWIDGKRNISIQVRKLNTEDLEEISKYLNKYVEEFNRTHVDAKLSNSFDFYNMLLSRLDTLYQNGIMGIILVVIALSFFLSFRLSLWVAWGIPASFLGMFIVANLVGITINMLSLFGMILIIGILVDDGIVIAENIYTHFEKGKSPKQAAVDGTMEVLPAVFTSVSTTIIAFMPFLFMKSGLEIVGEMSLIVIFCLAFSLVEGMFALPSHIGNPRILRRRKTESKFNSFRTKLDRIIFYLRDKTYIPLLKLLVRFRWAGMFIPMFFIAVTIGLIKGEFIGLTSFPNVPPDYFTIDLALKPGTNEKFTESFLQEFEKKVWQANREFMEKHNDSIPYVKSSILQVGSSFNGRESGPNAGKLFVFFKDMEGMPITTNDVKKRVAELIGTVPEAYKLAVGASNRWGAPVSISLLGRDSKKLEAASQFLKDELAKLSALSNILDNNQLGSQEIQIHLKPKAYTLGLNQNALMSQVRGAFFGAEAQRLQNGKDEIRIYVRYPKKGRQYLGQLDKMRIRTSRGTFPLNELVEFRKERGPVAINRYNGKKEIRVEAYMANPLNPVKPVIEDINETILPLLKQKFPDVNYMHQGQEKRSGEDGEQMVKYFSLALLVIIMILIIYFRSFLQAGMIVSMIPLGIMGAMWGHGLEGHPISMLSYLGMIALSGTIINDAVVFISKFNQNIKEGLIFHDALIDAGRSRFRPIMLTTITTTAGLYPLILGTSMQAKFLIPMAIALAYGIFIGTFFILTILPVFISVVNDIKRGIYNLISDKEYTQEQVEAAYEDIKAEMEVEA